MGKSNARKRKIPITLKPNKKEDEEEDMFIKSDKPPG